MKNSRMMMLLAGMSVLSCLSIESGELFTTPTEQYESEINKQQGELEVWKYMTGQFSRDCHLDDALLKKRYPNIQSLPISASQALFIFNSKHPDGQTSLEIVEGKKDSDLCERLFEGYKIVIAVSQVLEESGRGDKSLFSLEKREMEEILASAQEKKEKIE